MPIEPTKGVPMLQQVHFHEEFSDNCLQILKLRAYDTDSIGRSGKVFEWLLSHAYLSQMTTNLVRSAPTIGSIQFPRIRLGCENVSNWRDVVGGSWCDVGPAKSIVTFPFPVALNFTRFARRLRAGHIISVTMNHDNCLLGT